MRNPAGTPIPNQLRAERLAAGIATAEELAGRAGLDERLYRGFEDGRLLPRRDEFERIQAALGGIDEGRLYLLNYRHLIGLAARPGEPEHGFAAEFRRKRGAEQLLIALDEVTWLERGSVPAGDIDVFLNMSCSTQEAPHLLLDTVAVCEALGIRFAAAAGAAGCCGKPMIASGHVRAGEQWIRAKARSVRRAGAAVQANWCVACQLTTTTSAARREFTEGEPHPVAEVLLFDYLADRLEELGDRVPWQTGPRYRVVVEGHDWSTPHTQAWQATVRLLELVPSVEVVATYDGFAAASPCGGRAREKWQDPWSAPSTAAQIGRRRTELATMVRSLGADTVACMHQGCHQIWARYSGPDLTVRHAVSILAEALGCAHPDRFQAAVRIGDPDEIVAQTRSNWESWDLTEADARALAVTFLADDRFAAGVTACGCGAGAGAGCSEQLIDVDVLRATARVRL